MCWKSETVNKTSIAEEDIEVFKIVTLENCPDSNYEGIKMRVLPIYYPILTYGYYYPEENRFEMIRGGRFDGLLIKIYNYFSTYQCDNAFHSYKPNIVSIVIGENSFLSIKHPSSNSTRYGSYTKNNFIIMECIIPKGAHYAVNEEGECISDKLIIKGLKEIKGSKDCKKAC